MKNLRYEDSITDEPRIYLADWKLKFQYDLARLLAPDLDRSSAYARTIFMNQAALILTHKRRLPGWDKPNDLLLIHNLIREYETKMEETKLHGA